jgi:hypothetical protein
VKKAYNFSTSLALNLGGGSFKLIPLPAEAQRSPVEEFSQRISTTTAGSICFLPETSMESSRKSEG